MKTGKERKELEDATKKEDNGLGICLCCSFFFLHQKKKKGTQGKQGFMVSSCIIIQKVSPAFEDTRADGEVQTIDQEMRIWPQHRGPFNRH